MTSPPTSSLRIPTGGASSTELALSERLTRALSQREIPTLNGLRAIAILFVVLGHAGLPAPSGFGVLTFFTLSGFLITWLLLGEHKRSGTISLKQFFARRTLRIFPAYYAYSLLLLVIVFATHNKLNLPQTFASLFYVNNYYQAIHGDPNTGFSHTWSLAVEEQFYLLWAPAAVVLFRYKKMIPALITAICTLGLWRLFLIFGLHVDQRYIYEAFDTRADHLFIGCLLACILFERRWLTLLNVVCRPIGIALMVGALVLMNMGELKWGTGFRDAIAFTFEPTLVALLIPALVIAQGTLPYRFLESRPMVFIGRLSYSIYLYQQLLISPVENRLHGMPVAVQAVAAFGVTVVIALGSYNLIEKPFLRLKARLEPARKGPGVALAAVKSALQFEGSTAGAAALENDKVSA